MAKRVYAVKEIKRLMTRAADAAAPTAMGGAAILTTKPHRHDGPEHTALLPIERISTAETDPTLVAAPDGTGGVEFRAGAPTAADYLVGTAQAGLSAEIVVGTTPGGELGGTWASPTVDATHSGSAHHAAVSLAASADVLLGLTGQALALDTQNANKVLAGPTTGADAAPGFRALVAADLAAGIVGPTKVAFSATDRLLGRASAGAGNGEEITLTAAGRALIDDATAAAQRVTLGAARWAGAWSDATAYVPGDMVSLDGAAWVCLLANTALMPMSLDMRTAMVGTAPVWYSRLGEADPSTMPAADEMGVNDGTYVGSPTSVAGLLMGDSDTAVAFGVGKSVTFPGVDLEAGDWTLIARLDGSSDGGHNTPIFGAGTGGVLLRDYYGWLRADCAGVASAAPDYGVTLVGTPHFIVVTYIKSSGLLRYYIDGVLTAFSTFSPAWSAGALTSSFGWSGVGDEPAIHDRAVTSAEIAGLHVVGMGMVVWQRIEGATGATGATGSVSAATSLNLTDQGSDPSAPASGEHLLYTKLGGVYVEDHAGTVVGPLRAASSVAMYSAEDDSVKTCTSGTTTLLSYTVTLPAGFYIVSSEVYVNTAQGGGIEVFRDSTQIIFPRRDARTNVGLQTQTGGFVADGSLHTYTIVFTWEAGTAVFGLSSDVRWGRTLKFYGPL